MRAPRLNGSATARVFPLQDMFILLFIDGGGRGDSERCLHEIIGQISERCAPDATAGPGAAAARAP